MHHIKYKNVAQLIHSSQNKDFCYCIELFVIHLSFDQIYDHSGYQKIDNPFFVSKNALLVLLLSFY